MKSWQDLFHVLLQDIYFAERRIAKAVVGLSEACDDPLLRCAFSIQRFDTGEQIGRLEQMFEIAGIEPRERHCDAITGLLADAEKVVGRTAAGGVRDAGILASALAVERYQIARYGTLINLADRLGQVEIERLLRRSLEEERVAVALLAEVAGDSHGRAMRAA